MALGILGLEETKIFLACKLRGLVTRDPCLGKALRNPGDSPILLAMERYEVFGYSNKSVVSVETKYVPGGLLIGGKTGSGTGSKTGSRNYTAELANNLLIFV
jgi:hypothetical protein